MKDFRHVQIQVQAASMFLCLMLSSNLAMAVDGEENYRLVFATYLGGSEWEHARDVCADSEGNVYVVGGTFSTDFPTTPNALDRTYNGGKCDAFINKFSREGRLIWSTLLGGPNYDRIYAIELSPEGNLVVAGRGGPGFPTTPGSFQPQFHGTDNGTYGMQNGFVAKLTPDGSRLLWASFVGVQQLCRDVAVDTDGDIYLPFGYSGKGPTPPAGWFVGAMQKEPGGDLDCGVVKVSGDGSRVHWATWLGGTEKETQEGSIRVGVDESVYLFLNTRSANMPVTDAVFDRTYNGEEDCFLARVKPDGSDLIFGTYLGGSGIEWAINTHNLALDAAGNAYVSVVTVSSDFPTTQGVLSRERRGKNDIVLAKFSPSGTLLASTFVGGNDTENPDGIYVDTGGNVLMTGETRSTDFPVTRFAFQSRCGGEGDAIVVRLAADFSRILYATYMGGPSDDNGRAGFLGTDGLLYVTGSSGGPGWPVKSAFQPGFAGGGTGSYGAGDNILAVFAPIP